MMGNAVLMILRAPQNLDSAPKILNCSNSPDNDRKNPHTSNSFHMDFTVFHYTFIETPVVCHFCPSRALQVF